ncbi:MAG: hypothetical protein NC131_22215, partial [Roseburia sp.]|nr:hypothetical protein [Roseburia sp.]
MKKLLLLLSLIIALSPTISAADITLKFFSSGSDDNENAISGCSAGRLSYQTVEAVGFGFAEFNNVTSDISIRELRRPSASGNDYISIIASQVGASNKAFNYVNSARKLTSGNGSLTFKMLFGKIKSVKITFAENITGDNHPFDAKVNCTMSGSGADYTYTSIEPGKPIVLAYNLTNTAIKEISITYEEATNFKPSAPTVTVSEEAVSKFGYQLDETQKQISFTTLPNVAAQSMISCVIPDNADQVYYTLEKDLTVPEQINVTTLDNKGPSFTVLSSNGYSKQYWMSGYYSVNFSSVLPGSDTNRGSNDNPLNDVSKNPMTLRVFAYNSAAKTFSDVVSYSVKLNRITAPIVNAALTSAVEGQRYDAATKTVYYTKVNPTVYFKIDENASSTYYSTNFSDPLTTRTSYTSGSPITITNWKEGVPLPPVGRFDQIEIISQVTFLGRNYYDENKGEVTIINIIREAADIPGQWRLTGYIPYGEYYRPITGTAPSVITFNGAIQLQFDPQGEDYYSKIYDHNPTAAELGTFAENAVLIDKTTNMVDNIYVIGKDDFPANTPEIWLACAGKNDAGMGEPYVIRLALKGPDTPKFVVDGGGYPSQYASTNDYTVAGGSLKSHFEVTDETTVVEYIMVPQNGNAWPTQPVGGWTRLTVSNGKAQFPGDRVNTGRLFYRAGKPMTTGSSKYIYSDYEYIDFTRLMTANASLTQKTSWYGAYSDNGLVTINEDVRLVGIYSANGSVNDVTKYL